MQWDGTYIGTVSWKGNISLVGVIAGSNGTYWKLSVSGQEEYALVQQCNDMLPALLDNLKEVFGLHRIGTHICKRNSELYVLYRAVWDEEGVLEDVPLSQLALSLPSSCRCANEISRTFLFRWLFGLRSTQASIKIRTENDFSYPVSMNENKIESGLQLPSTVAAWIGKKPCSEICNWLGIHCPDDYHMWITRFASEFERNEAFLCQKDTYRWLFDIFCKRLYDLIDSRLEH